MNKLLLSSSTTNLILRTAQYRFSDEVGNIRLIVMLIKTQAHIITLKTIIIHT